MRVFYIGTKEGRYHAHDTENTLYNLQSLVGGFIEPVYLPEFTDQGIVLLANEEGLLARLDVNENLWPYFLVGPVVALSTEGDRFVGLDDAQVEFMREWLVNT